jgi:uncharacterized iron-regulated membrane protein
MMQLTLMATPVHFVLLGGLLVKMVWALFALSTLGLVLLGLAAFCQRSKIRILKLIKKKPDHHLLDDLPARG